MKPSIAIVGCGKVGTSLGRFLKQAGYPLSGVAGKRLESIRRAAELIGVETFSARPWEMTVSADVVFITTPDSAIEDACRKIAAHGGFKSGAVVLHCSGSLPSTLLASAGTAGCFIGSLHPLQSFAGDPTGESPFRGIIAAVEGDAEAVTSARRIATDLGAHVIAIRTEAKSLYHAAAVVSSNYLVVLLDIALQLMASAGIEKDAAVQILYPLIHGTLRNLEKSAPPAALTGPISRGDAATVKDHLSAMAEKLPALTAPYKTLGRHAVGLARARGRVPEEKLHALETLLKE